MADFETVTVRRDGAAATIVLDRPEALNAWNRAARADLLAALREAAGDDDVRAVRLTGAGRAFSSGADLRDITAMEDERTAEGDPDVQRLLRERYHPIITLVREMPKPVLAAVNGPAAGIGASLALASDLVIAAESAYLLLAFVNIGLVPDGGSSLLVPSRVGFARAAEMAMLGERIPAPKALDWGLINRVAPDDAFAAESDALIERLANGPTARLRRAPSASSTTGCTGGWRSSSSSRPPSSRSWRARRTSPRASRRSSSSGRPSSAGVEQRPSGARCPPGCE